MKFFFISLDSRTKILSIIVYLVTVVLTQPFNRLLFLSYFLIILLLLLLNKIPFILILKRVLTLLPFTLLVAILIPFFHPGTPILTIHIGWLHLTVSYPGWILFLNILSKSSLCILALIFLSSTTTIPELLQGLKYLKFPPIWLWLLSFMYRYLEALISEVKRMEQARNLRYFGGRIKSQIRTLGNLTAILFIRTFERGERLYLALCLRGYDGSYPTLNRTKYKDFNWIFLLVFTFILVLTNLVLSNG